MEGIAGILRKRSSDGAKPKPGTSGQLPGLESDGRPKERFMHSDAHVLAAEVSAHFGERKRFAAYLAVIRRMGVPQARTLFSSIKSGDANAANPRKFFMWSSVGTSKKAPALAAKPAKAVRKKRPGTQLDMTRFLG